LEVGKKIAYEFDLPDYIKEQLSLLERQLANIFGKKARQSSLIAFS